MPDDKYCTVKLAKEFAGDIQGVEDDALMDFFISAASRDIDHQTHRYWGPSATFTNERVKFVIGKFNDTFYAEYAPIISVSALADDTATYVEDTDYVVFEDEGRIKILNNVITNTTITQFSETPGQLLITYVAGQGTAKTGAYTRGIAAPEDIQLLCAAIAGLYYQAKNRMNLQGKTQGGASTSYSDIALPPFFQRIMDRRTRHIF